ncbi:MAG: formylmethanofuran dehydrogenase subunit C [Gammaproteobacteria bacterium]|nr:formylmethanofuran dehydrogenase subunit C [Gammaproteobacteria bacterium]
MSINLTLHTSPEVPLEAEVLCTDKLIGLTGSEIEKLPVEHGNRQVSVADFFTVKGSPDDSISIEGDLSKVKHLGAAMASGKLTISGNVGSHLGAGMTGGKILVEGDAGDWVAPEMQGGSVEIKGNAGHLVGSAYRGSPIGMSGGEILVHGDAKNEAGHAMRNGIIVIGGKSGDFAGVNMLAGSIFLLGETGIRIGAGMKRGTLVTMSKTSMLPTFSYSCRYQPAYLRMYLIYLQELGFSVSDEQLFGFYHRWCGDAIEMNRGEILAHDF